MTTREQTPGTATVSFLPLDRMIESTWESSLDLSEQAIHVRGFILEASVEGLSQCGSYLDEQELARAARFVRDKDRQRYILAHGGLRALLGRYARLAPEAIVYHYSENGKPSIEGQFPARGGLAFNMSHAHGRMLIAVARGREVGVDLELVRHDVEVEKLADRFFCSDEHAQIVRCPGEEADHMFFHYWVAKEAVLKAQGVGIASLHDCEIVSGGAAVRSTIRAKSGSAVQSDWTVQFLSCGTDWKGAVAAKGRDWIVQTGFE